MLRASERERDDAHSALDKLLDASGECIAERDQLREELEETKHKLLHAQHGLNKTLKTGSLGLARCRELEVENAALKRQLAGLPPVDVELYPEGAINWSKISAVERRELEAAGGYRAWANQDLARVEAELFPPTQLEPLTPEAAEKGLAAWSQREQERREQKRLFDRVYTDGNEPDQGAQHPMESDYDEDEPSSEEPPAKRSKGKEEEIKSFSVSVSGSDDDDHHLFRGGPDALQKLDQKKK